MLNIIVDAILLVVAVFILMWTVADFLQQRWTANAATSIPKSVVAVDVDAQQPLYEVQEFDLTELHIALLRRLVVVWNKVHFGAPHVSPWFPFGEMDPLSDISSIAKSQGLALSGSEANAVYEQVLIAFDVAKQVGVLEPGTYRVPDPVRGRSLGESYDLLSQFDVFESGREGQLVSREIPKRGSTLEVEVRPEHLRLLPDLMLEWYPYSTDEDGAHDVPQVDPKRPYGSTDVEGDMRERLGVPRDGDEPPPSELALVHFTLADVMQVFVQRAALAPGRYCRDIETGEWEKAAQTC